MGVVLSVAAWLVAAALHFVLWCIVHPLAGVPLAVVAWSAFVFFSPYRKCRWCKTPRRRRRLRGRRCWRCKGQRIHRRIGAKRIHKLRQSLGLARDEQELKP